MLHQTGVDDPIDPAAGGYAGLKGCGGIVQAGVTVLDAGRDAPAVATGISMVSLAVDVAVSPDKQTGRRRRPRQRRDVRASRRSSRDAWTQVTQRDAVRLAAAVAGSVVQIRRRARSSP